MANAAEVRVGSLGVDASEEEGSDAYHPAHSRLFSILLAASRTSHALSTLSLDGAQFSSAADFLRLLSSFSRL